MQRWCNVKPFCACIYFRSYCWGPCYDLVETVVGRSPLLWTATALSYVNFLLLLMLMFLSLLPTETCTQSHALAHTLTFLMKGLLFRAFPQIWVEPAMQRWCNGKPFHVCTYFRTYRWRPCCDLVEPVMAHSPLLWTATSLSYIKFLYLTVSVSLLHAHTHMQTVLLYEHVTFQLHI